MKTASENGKLLFVGVDGMLPATVLAFVREVRNVRPWDVAPTICHIMNWPDPARLEGRVIHEALDD